MTARDDHDEGRPEPLPLGPVSRSRAPGVAARVRRDLTRVLDVACRDPHLQAVLLTGGFSRGEGTVRRGAPVNDYDLVAVRSRPGTSRTAARVEALGDVLGLHVDYLEVWRPRLARVAPKLFWFDLRHGGRVIWGDARTLDDIPAFRSADLPAEEGLRLLANRAAGLLLARGRDDELVEVQSAKALLAVAEARLVVAGLYAPTVAERLARYRVLAQEDDAAASALPWIERAVAFKLDPDENPLVADLAWDAARRHLLDALPDVAASTPYGTVERWLGRGTWVEAAWHAMSSKGPRRVVPRPTARARRIALALLAETQRVPEETRRELEAFGLTASTWHEARDAAMRVRAATLQ